MKKIFAFLFLSIEISITANAQISTCAYYNGYWGQWKSHTTRYSSFPPSFEYGMRGNYFGFIIYKRGNHPSEYFFKFQIDSYIEPDKKTKKEMLKNNKWYVFSGTVEYYVTESYSTIESILKEYGFPYFSSKGKSGEPCAKRVAKAKIQIAPYKDHPRVYNIWFDGVGVGIDMEDTTFNLK